MYVRDLMTAEVVAAERKDNLADAYQEMLDRGFRHLPVIDGDGELVGVLSQRDIAARLGRNARADLISQTHSLEAMRVDQAMTAVVDTVDPDDPLTAAAEILLEQKISCLPVVEGTRLVGILTESDFVRLVLDQLEGRR
jgi:CBS domain-containing membrane protein